MDMAVHGLLPLSNCVSVINDDDDDNAENENDNNNKDKMIQ